MMTWGNLKTKRLIYLRVWKRRLRPLLFLLTEQETKFKAAGRKQPFLA